MSQVLWSRIILRTQFTSLLRDSLPWKKRLSLCVMPTGSHINEIFLFYNLLFVIILINCFSRYLEDVLLQCIRSSIPNILLAHFAKDLWIREHLKNRTTKPIVILASRNYLDEFLYKIQKDLKRPQMEFVE